MYFKLALHLIKMSLLQGRSNLYYSIPPSTTERTVTAGIAHLLNLPGINYQSASHDSRRADELTDDSHT